MNRQSHYQERFLNYCLWPYEPARPPSSLSLPALEYLFYSFDHHGIKKPGNLIVQSLLNLLGPSKTVFGIKTKLGQPCWEFYFYDYNCLDRAVPTPSILQCFSAYGGDLLFAPSSIPYFMFSVELNLQHFLGSLPLNGFNIYLGNPGGSLFGGKSYLCGSPTSPATFQNIYHFYNPSSHYSDIMQHISSSFHLSRLSDSSAFNLMRSYAKCDTLCIAHKSTADGLYFSGITINSLLEFISKYHELTYLSKFFSSRIASFNHLLFDFGLDCSFYDSQLSFPKASLYGVF